MASPVTAADFQPVTTATSVCEGFKRLLRLPGLLNQLFGWLLDDDGNVSEEAADSMADYLSPVGAIILWGGTSMPSDKWLVCNGQAVSRTTYATLFTRYGTAFGSGDGSTTFNLPNLQGRFARGVEASVGLGLTGGADSLTLTESQIPNKTHHHGVGRQDPVDTDELDFISRTWTKSGAYNTIQISGDNPNITSSFSDTGELGTTDAIEAAGSNTASTPIDNRPAFLSLYYIIKAS